MGRHKGKPMIATSVRVSPEFHALMIKHHIIFSEAMRVGASIILAEKGLAEYDNRLNISRRLSKIAMLLDKKCKEVEDLKQKIELRS